MNDTQYELTYAENEQKLYTLVQDEDLSLTKKIQEIAMSTEPYTLAKVLLRTVADADSLREQNLKLETEMAAFKQIHGIN